MRATYTSVYGNEVAKIWRFCAMILLESEASETSRTGDSARKLCASSLGLESIVGM